MRGTRPLYPTELRSSIFVFLCSLLSGLKYSIDRYLSCKKTRRDSFSIAYKRQVFAIERFTDFPPCVEL